MNTINALAFRQKFGETIDKVVKTGEPIVVERQNKPLVVLYPYEKKGEELITNEERKRREKAAKMMDQWRERNAKYFKGVDTTALIRKARDERYGKKWLKTKTHYWDVK